MLCVTLQGYAYPLKGIIKDKKTGELLIGSTVYVKEYPNLGTTTGLDGSFILKDIPQSKEVTLICSYISYNTCEHCIVSTEESVVIELEPLSMELDIVTVVGKADKSNDKSARMLEMSSMNVLNIMSAHSIEVSPDLNVASVIQRMSGVTMEKGNAGEGQYAILRGMDKRYNYTLVNGVKIPSPDNKNRYVPLNLFPSELLDRLEVTKSLTPDMEGDATGGAINMVMKDAPNRFTLQANLATGYSSMFFDRDFASFDHGNITKKSPRERYGKDYSATMSDFSNGTSDISYKTALPDMVAGLSAGNRYYDGKLGVVLAGSFQNHYTGTNSILYKDEMSQSESTVHLTQMQEREYSEQQMQYGVHVKMDYQINANHKLEWYNAFIGSTSNQLRETTTTNLSLNYAPSKGNALETWETRARRTVQSIITSTLQGEHQLTKRFAVDWSAVWSDARNKKPDNTYVSLENSRENFVDYVTADNAERRWERNTDRDLAGYLNLNYNINLGDLQLETKAGGMYRNKERTNKYVSYSFGSAGTTRPVMGVDFNNISEIEWKVNAPKGSVGPLDYDAGEDIGAGYLMGKLSNAKGHIIAGVRAEHTDQSYHMAYPPAGDEPDGGQDYWDVLPSLHLKYSPVEKMNIRASYFRSINRPGFFEIVPYSIINEDYMEFGNKNLNRATIDNVDLRWEWFPRATEQIMIGLFYKNIQDPIEYAYYTTNNRQFGYGPTNLGDAKNYGVEIDITKYFRNFGVKANYTYTHSSITTPKTLYQRNEEGKLERIERNQTRPLVGQAPHVANLSLLYKDTKYGWDAQLAGSYTGEKIAVASHFYESDHWDDGKFTLDFSCEKKFKKGLSVFAKANNLLDTTYKRYIKTVNDYNANFPGQDNSDGKTLIRKNTNGRTFLVGMRFKM